MLKVDTNGSWRWQRNVTDLATNAIEECLHSSLACSCICYSKLINLKINMKAPFWCTVSELCFFKAQILQGFCCFWGETKRCEQQQVCRPITIQTLFISPLFPLNFKATCFLHILGLDSFNLYQLFDQICCSVLCYFLSIPSHWCNCCVVFGREKKHGKMLILRLSG